MSGNHEELRKRFIHLRWNWHDFWDSDPDRAIAMIEEAIGIAETVQEPHWEMEARHWLAQALVFTKRDYGRALPLVVQSAVEARKPIYQGWQTRICLYQDLIAAYVGTDAVSHADTIEAALKKMQAEAAPESQCTRCLLGERTTFELKRQNLAAAHLTAQTYLSKAWSTHHRSIAQSHLAHIAFLKGEWQLALEHAEAAEKIGEQADNPDTVIEGLVFQAVAHLQFGNAERAQDCFQQSEARRALCGVTLDEQYWQARAAYFEFAGDIDGAIASRQLHLQEIAGHGALREEAEALIDLCRLQKQKGEIAAELQERTRLAIDKLKVKADLSDKLSQLLHDL